MAEAVTTEGFGTKLAHKAYDGTGSATEIAQIVDVEPPESEVTDIDVTHMQSPDHTKEYQPGLIEPGESTLSLLFTPAQAVALDGLLRIRKTFIVTYADLSTDTFKGYIKKTGRKVAMDDVVKMDVTIRATGKVTHAVPPTP